MTQNRTNISDLLRQCREYIEQLIWKIKQRWVVRLIIIYSMSFWLVVQACAATFPTLNVADGVLKLVVLAGLAGLPVTMMLARGLRAIAMAGRDAGDPSEDEQDPIASMSVPFFLSLIVATCLLIFLLILQTWTP